MKKKLLMLGGILLTLSAISIPLLFKHKTQKPEFEIATLTRKPLLIKIAGTGGVQPQNRLEIKPPVAGRIESILFREGDSIQKGTILAWMSSSERVALMDVARSQGEAEVKRWEEIYRPTPIVAPMTGILIYRKVEPGQTLTAQDVALVMSNNLIVRADVDETDIAKIKVGQRAVFTLDAYPQSEIEAKVQHIAFDAKQVNNVTVYSVDLLPKKVPDFMRSGMSANVGFIVDKKEDALVLRSDAIQNSNGESYILVKSTENAEPVRTPVTIGLSDGRETEITSDLPMDTVILIPKLSLQKSKKNSSGLNPFMGGGRREPRR